MNKHVITGGQSGIDQAAWRAAKKWGYRTSGMMPKEFMTEYGAKAEFVWTYGARDSRSENQRVSDQSNIRVASAVLWLGPIENPRYDNIFRDCSHTKARTGWTIDSSMSRRINIIEDMAGRMERSTGLIPVRDFFMGLNTVCIAGPKESSYPGIGELAENFLNAVFQMIRDKTDWDSKGYGKNMALMGKIFEEGPIEEPLEENLEEDDREQLEREYKEAASLRVSPPLDLPKGWLPGQPY